MREHEYHQAIIKARQRQLDGRATDDDRRYLKQAEADGIDADALTEDEEVPAWDGTSSEPSPTSTAPTGRQKRQSRRSPARSTASGSTPDPTGSATARPATTDGPSTDALSGTDGKADTAS